MSLIEAHLNIFHLLVKLLGKYAYEGRFKALLFEENSSLDDSDLRVGIIQVHFLKYENNTFVSRGCAGNLLNLLLL